MGNKLVKPCCTSDPRAKEYDYTIDKPFERDQVESFVNHSQHFESFRSTIIQSRNQRLLGMQPYLT